MAHDGQTPLAFVWDNFGFMHDERVAAVVAAAPERRVAGVELYTASHEYGWRTQARADFEKHSLFDGAERGRHGRLTLAWRLVRACRRIGARDVFMCGHGTPGIFLASLMLRLTGVRVFALTDSKFDDMPRRLIKELAKSCYYAVFSGAMVASDRSADYLRFLGMGRRPIALDYDNRSLAAIRTAAGSADVQTPFAERPFVCVARLVPKKNHAMLLMAYAQYLERTPISPRRLILCGSGELEDALKAQATVLGIADRVEFRGWQDEATIARTLAGAVALVLCSVEEQFGIAVIEALAVGVPVIVTEPVGARDRFVRSGREGFVVEPDNPGGVAFFMNLLGQDEALWRSMRTAAIETAAKADISAFAASALALASGSVGSAGAVR